MYTSMLLAVLTGAIPAATGAPSWQTDYLAARKEGTSAKKPLAVFLSSGNAGWEKVAGDDGLGAEVKHILAANYVCVYVDAGTPEGKRLAQAFQIPNGLGIVISNRTGELQAFRHEGDLTNPTLVRYLQRYADPERSVLATETNPGEESQASGYSGNGPTGGNYGAAPASGSIIQSYYPSFGRSSGGC